MQLICIFALITAGDKAEFNNNFKVLSAVHGGSQGYIFMYPWGQSPPDKGEEGRKVAIGGIEFRSGLDSE